MVRSSHGLYRVPTRYIVGVLSFGPAAVARAQLPSSRFPGNCARGKRAHAHAFCYLPALCPCSRGSELMCPVTRRPPPHQSAYTFSLCGAQPAATPTSRIPARTACSPARPRTRRSRTGLLDYVLHEGHFARVLASRAGGETEYLSSSRAAKSRRRAASGGATVVVAREGLESDLHPHVGGAVHDCRQGDVPSVMVYITRVCHPADLLDANAWLKGKA